MSKEDKTPIVSLLPSATEILHFIGAGSRLVGCTHECDYPKGVADEITHVTRSLLPPGLTAAEIDAAVAKAMKSDAHTIYALDADALHTLRPRYIVTQKLCDVCAVPERNVRALACSLPSDCTVVSADPSTLLDLFESIQTVGDAVGAPKTRAMVRGLKERLDYVQTISRGHDSERVVVLEWPDPPYAPGHWVPDQVTAAGGICVLGKSGSKSERVTWETVKSCNPDVIVLAFCGFDLEECQRRVEEIRDLPDWKLLTSRARVYATDASAYFSRPGPRLIDGVELLAYMLLGDKASGLKKPVPGQISEYVSGQWIDLSSGTQAGVDA